MRKSKNQNVVLGPFETVDNYHDVYGPLFHPREDGQLRLREATNVDFLANGWVDRRAGTTNRRTGVAYRALYSGAGLLLVQDSGSIYSIDPESSWAATELVSGLNASLTVEFHTHNNIVYWTNGSVYGKILSDGTATHWGLENPTVTVAQVSGSLVAGTYLVSATLVDSSGLESGVYDSIETTLAATGGLSVNITSPDSNATHVNIYVSPRNESGLFWNQKVAVGALPATVLPVRTQSDRPLVNQNLRGPFAADGISSFLGYMLLWKSNFLFRSKGLVDHLFYPATNIAAFPHDIKSVLGLQTGYYVITAETIHWISGPGPSEWQNKQVASGNFAQGGIVLPGRVLPMLQQSGLIALMAGQEEGSLICGLPDGSLIYLLQDRFVNTTAPTRAQIVYLESSLMRQLFMLLL